MAKGYKRDSRGRFNGGYGPGALGGKGAYTGRLTRGGSSGAKTARTSSSQRQNTRISAVGRRVGSSVVAGTKRAATGQNLGRAVRVAGFGTLAALSKGRPVSQGIYTIAAASQARGIVRSVAGRSN